MSASYTSNDGLERCSTENQQVPSTTTSNVPHEHGSANPFHISTPKPEIYQIELDDAPCTRRRTFLFKRDATSSSKSCHDVEDPRTPSPKPFRLQSTRRKTPSYTMISYLCYCCNWCTSHKTTSTRSGLSAGVLLNRNLAMYLHWLFRINFLLLFTLSCVVFFTLIVGFTGILALVGHLDSTCVQVGDADYKERGGNPFAEVFSLSWTTFATVGYGSVTPALTNQSENSNNCAFVTLICSFESFIGVLYSGFCGAILFGKVLRIQSQAQVMFSNALVVRFGAAGIGKLPGAHHQNTQSTNIPCPILEFRVVNRLFDEVGGEIMDATLNVVANIDAANDINQKQNHEIQLIPLTLERDESNGTQTRPQLQSLSSRTTSASKSETTVSNRGCSRMRIEPSDHPFFKRVWLVRHVLDESSPILAPRVRKAIKRLGGYWPQHLDTHQDIRNSLKFNQILVSLHGVSNVSASDVYSQKIYDFADLNVGYEFVNLLYREGSGGLKVDTSLVNDVREQAGGGGEPLIGP